MTTDQAVRAMALLMPRLVGRVKRTEVPEALRSMSLAPRHLSLLSNLLIDGPLSVNVLAERLEVAPTTVSLMVSDLTRQGVLVRRTPADDRRRTIVAITDDEKTRKAIEDWLANGARAWRKAFEALSPSERAMFVATIRAYENETALDLE